jgi:hypothetical protein
MVGTARNGKDSPTDDTVCKDWEFKAGLHSRELPQSSLLSLADITIE